jgi:hypothetical protein
LPQRGARLLVLLAVHLGGTSVRRGALPCFFHGRVHPPPPTPALPHRERWRAGAGPGGDGRRRVYLGGHGRGRGGEREEGEGFVLLEGELGQRRRRAVRCGAGDGSEETRTGIINRFGAGLSSVLFYRVHWRVALVLLLVVPWRARSTAHRVLSRCRFRIATANLCVHDQPLPYISPDFARDYLAPDFF